MTAKERLNKQRQITDMLQTNERQSNQLPLSLWRDHNARQDTKNKHYENKPIQIHWKFYHPPPPRPPQKKKKKKKQQKNKNKKKKKQIKIRIFFILLLKT